MLSYYKIKKDESYIDMAMKILEKEEGFREAPYLCSAKKLTWLYGWNIEDNPPSTGDIKFIANRMRQGLSLKEIGKIFLLLDIEEIHKTLDEKYDFFKHQPEVIKAVLVCMAYQMGIAGLAKFKKTLLYCENRKYDAMAVEMLDSDWHKQTPQRAKRMSDLTWYCVGEQ